MGILEGEKRQKVKDDDKRLQTKKKVRKGNTVSDG